MRLTLRTLLAYMDDILEPADHEDLGKKIEASDFATELIHRSRDTVRRLRLGAPAVLSEGSDDVLDSLDLGDANSVAEYLDNTLPPEQVADFERICLEPGTQPDMHLAEVASCHHVLTMVLGEPAEVDTDLKARMYQLPSQPQSQLPSPQASQPPSQQASGQKLRIEPGHASAVQPAPPVQTQSPVAPPLAQPASVIQTELPDYLREAAASKRRSRNLAIAMTVCVLGGIGFWLANPVEPQVPSEVAGNAAESFDDGELDIQGLGMPPSNGMPNDATTGNASEMAPAPAFDPDGSTAAPAPAFVAGANNEAQSAPAFEPGVVDASDPPQVSTEAPSAETTGAIADVASALDSSVQDLTGQDVTGQELLGEKVMESELELVGTAPEVAAAATVDLPPVADLPDPALVAEDSAPLAAGALGNGEQQVLVASTPQTPMPSELTIEPTGTASEELTPTEPVGPQRLGNYLGNNDVLLTYNEAQDTWVRLPPRSPVSTGDVLLTLPRFFTHVVLADVNTYLSGGTRVRIPVERFESSATTESELNLEVVYGRTMLNAGLNGSQVALLVDDQLREFTLAGSASLAVDVQRMFVPGNDYENQAAPILATWYLTSGSIEWPTATGGTQTIEGQMVWRTIDGVDEIPEPISELPEWIGREPMTDMQRSARDDLSKELEADRSVDIRLLELTDGKGLGRRREVRVLAAASSMYVGEFDPLVKALNDSDQNNAWDEHIRDLRQAMALSPDVATSVREAFVKTRGEEAARDLFEMARGYSLKQVGETREAVQAGALSQLLKWLDHDSLDYRVLAISNIREITGKFKGYRPDDSKKGRTKNLRKLWAEFEANELLPF